MTDSHVWYESPLLVAVVSVTLTLAATQVGGLVERWHIRRRRAKSLMIALAAEVYAIREALSGPAKTAFKAWSQGKTLRDYSISYPRTIYDANAAHFGEIHDHPLVQNLTALYSLIERTIEVGRRIQSKVYGEEAIKEYVSQLVGCWYLSILLDMHLRALVKDVANLKTPVHVSQADSEDGKACIAMRNAFEE